MHWRIFCGSGCPRYDHSKALEGNSSLSNPAAPPPFSHSLSVGRMASSSPIITRLSQFIQAKSFSVILIRRVDVIGREILADVFSRLFLRVGG